MLRPFLLLLVATTPLAAAAQRIATAGPYEIELLESEYFARELSQIEFRVLDRARGEPSPVERAVIHCVISMPAMPGMPPFDEIAHTEGAPGVYGVHADFAHGGEYRLAITLNVRDPATVLGYRSFDVQLPLAVQDPDDARLREGRVRPYSLELEAPPAPGAGEAADLRFRVRRELEPVPNEAGVSERRFETVTAFDMRHERLVHLFIVREDFGAFAHEHPELASDGTASLSFAFPTAGRYLLFADVAPRGAGQQVLDAEVVVGGRTPRAPDRAAAPLERGARTALGALTAEWTWDGDALPARRTTLLRARLRDASDRPVTDLQPYLGAGGHLAMIHEDGKTFVHAHPNDGDAAAAGTVAFVTWLPKPGLYHGWAQFQRAGEVLTTSLVVRAD